MSRNMRGLNSSLLVGFAVLAGILVLSSAEGAQADWTSNFATGMHRPANLPADFGITPFGYFHPSCVLPLAEGETLLADGSIERTDGTTEAAASCSYPHYTLTGELVAADATAPGAIDAINYGWLEYVSATTRTSYGKMSTTWVVPPAPKSEDQQIILLFSGFEDKNNVVSMLEPVLQFGPTTAGGGNFWAMASWNCCINGVTRNSPLMGVNPGDTVVGTISPTCKSGKGCATWNVVSDDKTTKQTTTLSKTPAEGQVWNWATGASILPWDFVQCSDYPANTGVTFTVQLFDQDLKLIENPGWVGTPAGKNVKPKCGFGLKVTSTKERLEYSAH